MKILHHLAAVLLISSAISITGCSPDQESTPMEIASVYSPFMQAVKKSEAKQTSENDLQNRVRVAVRTIHLPPIQAITQKKSKAKSQQQAPEIKMRARNLPTQRQYGVSFSIAFPGGVPTIEALKDFLGARILVQNLNKPSEIIPENTERYFDADGFSKIVVPLAGNEYKAKKGYRYLLSFPVNVMDYLKGYLKNNLSKDQSIIKAKIIAKNNGYWFQVVNTKPILNLKLFD
jgi:hypothetical protein